MFFKNGGKADYIEILYISDWMVFLRKLTLHLLRVFSVV